LGSQKAKSHASVLPGRRHWAIALTFGLWGDIGDVITYRRVKFCVNRFRVSGFWHPQFYHSP